MAPAPYTLPPALLVRIGAAVLANGAIDSFFGAFVLIRQLTQLVEKGKPLDEIRPLSNQDLALLAKLQAHGRLHS
jgi:hypothetical protein